MSKAKAKTEELGNLSREELLERARNLYGEVWKPGHGAFEDSINDEPRPSVEHSRNYFLHVMHLLAPEVLDDLGKEPFRLYRRTPAICYEADKERLKKHKQHNVYDQIREHAKWQQQRPAGKDVENAPRRAKVDIVERHIWTTYERPSLKYVENQWRDPLGRRPPFPIDANGSIAAFKASLFEWSQRHNLNYKWCRERAYATLDLWCCSQGCRKARIWHDEPAWQPIMAFSGDRHKLDFVFRHETLYPREGFRQKVKQRILEACEEELDAFLDERERRAKEGGMIGTPHKREPKHFEWLVYYQVKQQSFESIAKAVHASRKTVEDGVKSTAKMCKLDLRSPSRPGRPKKQ